MALVNYSASSDSEDDRTPPTEGDSTLGKQQQRCPLPSAKSLLSRLSLQSGQEEEKEKEEAVIDDPDQHEGRLRSFKHERGNWATYVYIPLPAQLLDDLQDNCLEHFPDELELRRPSSVHISLSKTIVLQYHQIAPFVACLEQAIKSFNRIHLTQLDVLNNEERTRTFLTACTGNGQKSLDQLSILGNRVDRVMEDFRLSTFYEDPLFHASFLWCLGDQSVRIKSHLPALEKISLPLSVNIDRICCKSGFKQFNFQLQ